MKFEFNDDSQKICNSADVVNYGIQCDICGNKFQSVSNINGRRYCVGCYYKTFIKDNQQTEIDQFKQQLAEKDKEIERLRKNHRISYTNQKKAYENLKNSVNAKSLIKYPIKLDGCLIKDEQDLFDYAKESTRDIIYLRNERTKLAIQELAEIERLLYESHYKEIDNKYYAEYEDINSLIDSRIKALEELKGEQT